MWRPGMLRMNSLTLRSSTRATRREFIAGLAALDVLAAAKHGHVLNVFVLLDDLETHLTRPRRLNHRGDDMSTAAAHARPDTRRRQRPDRHVDILDTPAVPPDLIVGSFDAESTDAYNRIAPTLPLTGESWRDSTRLVAEGLGRVEVGDAVIAENETIIDAARRRIEALRPLPALAVLGVPRGDGTFLSVTDETPLGVLAGELGLVIEPTGADGAYPERSIEQLLDVVGDDQVVVYELSLLDPERTGFTDEFVDGPFVALLARPPIRLSPIETQAISYVSALCLPAAVAALERVASAAGTTR